MNFHPISNIFHVLPKAELDSLAADIKANGLQDPIWLYEGQILDGRNRWKACELAGVEPKTREFNGDKREALRFVWSRNRHRRHLDPGQVAVAEAKRAKLDAEYAAEVEKMKAEQPKGGRPKKGEKPAQQIAPVKRMDRQTATVRAKAVGTNRCQRCRYPPVPCRPPAAESPQPPQ
jgi:hypothetical protein